MLIIISTLCYTIIITLHKASVTFCIYMKLKCFCDIGSYWLAYSYFNFRFFIKFVSMYVRLDWKCQQCLIEKINNISWLIKPFNANVSFLYPLKTSENQRLPDVFRGYRNETLAWKGLMFSIFLISVGVTSYILAFFDPNFARSRKYFQNVFPLFIQISEMI